MSDPTTPFLGLTKPIVNDEAGEDLWGDKLNTNFDKLDNGVKTNSNAIAVLQGTALTDAPSNGKTYGRKDAAWADVSTSVVVDWANITGKPATFPPTLPIAQVGVTNLIADQATQNSQITANASAIAGKEPTINPGTAAQFWRGDKTWQPLSSITVDAYTKAEADARFEPVITAGTTAQYWRGNKTWATLDKAAVGLGNVDNTSDAAKPISTATATALAGKEPTIAAGNPAYFWAGDKTWKAVPPAGLTDAPSDGVTYGRKNAAWTAVSGPVTVGLTAPVSPRPGDLWYKSDVCLLYVYYDDGNTQQWVVTIPQQSIDGLDARYTLKAGDTMTGPLVLPGNPTLALQAAPKQYVDGRVLKTGDVMTGNLDVTQPAGSLAGSYAIVGHGIGGGGGICGFNSGNTVYGVLGLGSYSFSGSGAFYNAGVGQFAGSLTIGGGLLWSNISNFQVGYNNGANITSGTSQFDLMFSGASFYRFTPTWMGPSLDNAYYLGVSSNRYYAVYAVTGTIQTSDEREKQDIRPLDEREKAAAVRLKGLITTYRWKDRVASGQDERIYIGVIAQRIEEALAAEGLDAASYAMWTKDPLEEWIDAVIGEDGAVIEPGHMRPTGEYRYSVDYSQVLAFIIGGM